MKEDIYRFFFGLLLASVFPEIGPAWPAVNRFSTGGYTVYPLRIPMGPVRIVDLIKD